MHAQSTAASAGSMVQNEIRFLEFLGGGSPLTPTERQQAAEIVALGMRNKPDAWKAEDLGKQQLLNGLAKASPSNTNALHEVNRYHYAFHDPNYANLGAEYVQEQAIVNAHDPIIAMDRVHQRLVTRHSLQLLEQASGWAARSFKYPPPRADFQAIVARNLKEQLATLEPSVGDGIAHIERDFLYTVPYFASLSAQQRTVLFDTDRNATFHDMQDPVSAQWQLAEAAGMLSRFAANQTESSMAFRTTTQAMLQSQQRILNNLHNAGVSGSPGCNVSKNSYSERYANGCIK